MVNIDKLRVMLLKSHVSISEFSRATNISRTSLHKFLNGGNIRSSTANVIMNALEELHSLSDLPSTSGNVSVKAGYIIELQRNRIRDLEERIELLKSRIKLVESE